MPAGIKGSSPAKKRVRDGKKYWKQRKSGKSNRHGRAAKLHDLTVKRRFLGLEGNRSRGKRKR